MKIVFEYIPFHSPFIRKGIIGIKLDIYIVEVYGCVIF